MQDDFFESLTKQANPKTGAYLFFHKTAIKLRFICNIIRSIIKRNSYQILKIIAIFFVIKQFINLLTFLIY